MKPTIVSILVLLLLSVTLASAQEGSTFNAYVDSDICAHLMLGPINSPRIACSQKTHKDGSNPVLVNLGNNAVYSVDKQKMLNKLVGQFAAVSGEVKGKAGRIKLASVNPISADTLPAGGFSQSLLANRTSDPQLYEAIRHELAMMPYITEFDFISFLLAGSDVILTGWTVRTTNRSTAENLVKNIEGVENVVNNIDILPLGSMDMDIRAGARVALQRHLSRYFWGSGSDIKIIVKNGNIILLGTVASESDSNIAYIQCRSVPSSFQVFNMLRVQGAERANKS